MSLTNCTVSGNSVGVHVNKYGGAGGGLYTYGGTLSFVRLHRLWKHLRRLRRRPFQSPHPGATRAARCLLTNCTVSNNSTESTGGGLDMESGVTTLTNCTMTGNTSGDGGSGIYVETQLSSDIPTLTNTIVAGNHFNLDVFGPVDPGSANNFIGSGGGLSGISNGSQGNQIGTPGSPIDPLLAPLGNYDGPTFTMALLPSSPAIGGGTSVGAPTTDQRGLPRSGHIDIGAFQSQGFTLTPELGSTPQSTQIGTAFTNPLALNVIPNKSPRAGRWRGHQLHRTHVRGLGRGCSATTVTIAERTRSP